MKSNKSIVVTKQAEPYNWNLVKMLSLFSVLVIIVIIGTEIKPKLSREEDDYYQYHLMLVLSFFPLIIVLDYFLFADTRKKITCTITNASICLKKENEELLKIMFSQNVLVNVRVVKKRVEEVQCPLWSIHVIEGKRRIKCSYWHGWTNDDLNLIWSALKPLLQDDILSKGPRLRKYSHLLLVNTP